MAVSQVAVAVSLILLSQVSAHETGWIALLACATAFSSATQDIVVDAYRIEAADNENQAAMSRCTSWGIELPIDLGAGALLIADFGSWSLAYLSCGVMMGIGLITTLLVSEPTSHEQKEWVNTTPAATIASSERDWRVMVVVYFKATVCCTDHLFFAAYGTAAWAILALVSLYRLSDIVMGVMANPFYLDQGYSKAEIASIAKGLGVGMSIFGAFIGGLLVVRFGVLKTMLGGALLVAVTNLMFAFLAEQQADLRLLAIVISLDNLSGGVSATSFVAYLSGLTQREFTATQYALFSSLMTLPAN